MTGIRPFMPDQHRDFFALLPYFFIATTDDGGWPVATVLTGQPGFIQSPDPSTPGRRRPAATGRTGREAVRGRPAVRGPGPGLRHPTPQPRQRPDHGGGEGRADAPRSSRASATARNTSRPARWRRDRPRPRRPRRSPSRRPRPWPRSPAPTRCSWPPTPTFRRGGENGGVDISHRGGLPGFVKVAATC